LNNRGITLIELIIVLAILSIIFSISIPQFNDIIARYELQTTARMVASDLRLAQQMAISKGEYYRILFDLFNRDRYQLLSGTKMIKQVFLPKGVKLSATSFNGNTVMFTPLGAPVPAGRIMLTGRNNENLFVIVAVATGRVRISSNPPD